MGVVICPPMAQEALRSHRTLRVLSDQLAAAGAEVLRFDYYGAGDSAGESRDGLVSTWMQNIREATKHLRELAPVRRLTLVGMRLGGTMAALAEVPAVNRLILWDPILEARSYLQELTDDAIDSAKDEWEVRGFPVTSALRSEIQRLDVTAIRRLSPDVRIITTQDSPGLVAFQAAAEAKRARVEVQRIEAPRAWAEDEAFGLGALPSGVLRKIVEWVS
jgi:pimeloyl-ACP methyl ester carboxylesterase